MNYADKGIPTCFLQGVYYVDVPAARAAFCMCCCRFDTKEEQWVAGSTIDTKEEQCSGWVRLQDVSKKYISECMYTIPHV